MQLINSIRRFFSFQSRATLNNPSVGLNDESIWASLTGDYQSATGESITPKKFLSLAAVWQAVNLISGDLAKLPINLYKKSEDNERSVVGTDQRHRLVRRKPNEEMNAFFFWRTVFVHKLIWSNAYIYIERNMRGEPIGLLPLLPDRTEGKRKGGMLYYETEISGRATPVPVPMRDVIHLRGISIDAINGHELIVAARETAGRALAAGNFASRFFKQGARAGGILELPANMSKPAKDTIEEGFRKTYEGSDNSFKTVILRDGAKFHQLTIAPNEGQMSETREDEVREIARFFNLAPSRLGLSDSVSYNSKAEDNQAYLDSTLSPHMIELQQELWAKLLSDSEQEADELYFEHNTRALTQMNPLQRMQMYNIGIRASMFSPNECREWENLNKRADGRGDEYVLQTNLTKLDEKGNVTYVDEQQPQPQDNPDTQQELSSNSRDDQPVGLNGAQITAAVQVLLELQQGNIANYVAVELLVAVGIEREIASKMVAETGKMPPPEPVAEPSADAPPAEPLPDPDNRSKVVRRVMFALARQARHKAEKPHAFRQWLEGNLVSFRSELVDAGSDQFDAILGELKRIYQITPPEKLPSEVDKFATTLEQ